MESLVSRKHLWVYFALLLGASWTVQIITILVVGDLNSAAATPWLAAMMFFPTMASLIYWFGFNRKAFTHVRFWPGNPIYLVIAGLIPAAIALAVLVVAERAGWGSCDFFRFSSSGANIQKGPWSLGVGMQSWPLFAANIAVTAVVFSFINGIVAVGEEFAWRGFLQRPMIENFGVVGGVALLGVVWAYWHLPSNLAGYNYAHAPVLGGLVLFPALLVADSFIMAWLTIRARSFWPAVLMHGSGNGIQEGILSNITLADGVSRLWIDLSAIAMTWVVAGLCLFVLYRSDTSRRSSGGFVIGSGSSRSALEAS